MVMLMIIWTIMVIITVMIMIIAIVPRTSGKDAKALVKESDRIVGYKSLSTIYCYYTTTRHLFLLYGGNISYNIILCYMVDCTGGAITWQMQCQAHAVKATMDDFFWWKLQVQIQLQIFCTKFNANKITSNNFCMTIPVIVIVICRNAREKKSISIKCKSTLSRHTSLMHFDSDIAYVLQ